MRLSDFLLLGAVFVAAPIGLMSGYAAWRASITQPLEEEVPVQTIAPVPDAEELIREWRKEPDREVDKVLFQRIFEPLGTDKVKDLVPGAPYKINLYQDDGLPLPNRAKVDLDRDDKWDEKWTIADGVIREVSPNDDEQYTQRFFWEGRYWIDEQDRGEPPPADPTNPKASGDLIADTVMGFKDQDIGVDKLKDTTRQHPFKVNVYQDAGHAVVNRAKVDRDRDDRWDEKWTFEGDRVTRKVSPSDDEQYTEVWVWRAGDGWVRE